MNAQRPPHLVIAVLLLSMLLTGCGQSLAPSVAAPQSNALKGNWLLAGSLPVSGLLLPLPQQFGLTMTLDVSNGQVLAEGSYVYQCVNGAVGGRVALPAATITADGSFTLQTQQLSATVPTVMLSIHGKASTVAGENWTGTYTATNANTGCVPVSGAFTAMPIQTVSGTFLGMGTLGHSTGMLGPPLVPTVPASSVSIAFVQGGPASLDPPLPPFLVNSATALSGTITVTGSSCFTSGTANIPAGLVFGDGVNANFVMNDGSTLLVFGAVTDLAATMIRLSTFVGYGWHL